MTLNKQIMGSHNLLDSLIEIPSQVDFNNDRTVILFGDYSYKLTLHIFEERDYNEEIKNSVLTFSKQEKNKLKILLRDSLYCMYANIEFRDFNNDKIKDVLIFYYTGARTNPTYHLYIVDPKNRKLTYVKGFEELPNPDLERTTNIITSVAQAGMNYYSFYRINAKNKLINLGYSFEADIDDSIKHENSIRKIFKKKKITAYNNALPKVRAGHWNNEHQFAYNHWLRVTSFF